MSCAWSSVLSLLQGVDFKKCHKSSGEERWERCMEGISLSLDLSATFHSSCYLLSFISFFCNPAWVLVGNILGTVDAAHQFELWLGACS